jgi:putative N-acetylmannosamine-6-phosphate epimerase
MARNPGLDIIRKTVSGYVHDNEYSIDDAVSLLENISIYGPYLNNVIAEINSRTVSGYVHDKEFSIDDAHRLIKAAQKKPRY